MAVYCNDDCEKVGPICDFCVHYRDDRTNGYFQGEGHCEAKKIRADASDSCEDDFHCFQTITE